MEWCAWPEKRETQAVVTDGWPRKDFESTTHLVVYETFIEYLLWPWSSEVSSERIKLSYLEEMFKLVAEMETEFLS